MFDIVYDLIMQFIQYLPDFTLIYIILGIAGNIVFRKM